MKLVNAIIERVSFGWDEYGVPTMGIALKTEGGGSVVFGGRILLSKDAPYRKKRRGLEVAECYIRRVMKIAGVKEFGKLNGSPCRVIFKGDGQLGDRIIGIQEFLGEDRFIPEYDFDEPANP